ncbi:hypothetical protein EGK76_00285 [Luteimonas sp. 100069]|nr:hypothetical protein EGK76_00285 [Luteimonas sp. 100069]
MGIPLNLVMGSAQILEDLLGRDLRQVVGCSKYVEYQHAASDVGERNQRSVGTNYRLDALELLGKILAIFLREHKRLAGKWLLGEANAE